MKKNLLTSALNVQSVSQLYNAYGCSVTLFFITRVFTLLLEIFSSYIVKIFFSRIVETCYKFEHAGPRHGLTRNQRSRIGHRTGDNASEMLSERFRCKSSVEAVVPVSRFNNDGDLH